jgi:hypothetical protein
MWFQAVVYRRADAAAVNEIASGSQHSTMSAISHRIARSLSVSAPRSSATYRIGATSVSTCRPLAATEARSVFRLARGAGRLVPLTWQAPRGPCAGLQWRTVRCWSGPVWPPLRPLGQSGQDGGQGRRRRAPPPRSGRPGSILRFDPEVRVVPVRPKPGSMGTAHRRRGAMRGPLDCRSCCGNAAIEKGRP